MPQIRRTIPKIQLSLPNIARQAGTAFSPNFGGALGGKFGIAVRGVQQLNRKLKKIEKQISIKALDGLKRALIVVESEAVRMITSGYFKPAVDTGHMRRSLTHKVTNFDSNIAEGLVGLNVFYAIYVHEGTIYMQMRPFLTDALQKKQLVVKAILVNAFKKGLRV